MKKAFFPIGLIATTALFVACRTAPTSTDLLEQTRKDYSAMEISPDVERYAALEVSDAVSAMHAADEAANQHQAPPRIDDLAYIAKSKIALAQEVSKQKMAEADVDRITRERDRLVLNQRTSEANRAKLDAAQSRQIAQAALLQTRDAAMRAAQLESELADLSAKQTERGMVITLGDVLFAFDKSTLTPAAHAQARKLAQVLKQHPERKVLVEGYTDSVGSAAYNQALSERRAESVRHILQEFGVASARIRTHGYGKEFPVAPNDTADNRHLNRRVEIVLSDESGNLKER